MQSFEDTTTPSS